VRRGQTFARFNRLDLFYQLPKSRIPLTSTKALLPWSKLVSRPGFSTSFWLKMPKSHWESVFLDSILGGFWTNRAETNVWNPSYIYLETLITEFFCNLSVPAQSAGVPSFDPLRCGADLSAVGPGYASKTHTKYY